MKSPMLRLSALWVASMLGWPGVGTAATSSAVSPAFSVDTRSASVLSGRVVAAATGLPVAGVTVTVGSSSTTTAAGTGVFRFTAISVAQGAVVTVSKTGYASGSKIVATAPGTRSIDLGDIALGTLSASGSDPQVISVEPQLDGLFLGGVSVTNRYDAELNWNGNTPGEVEWRVNGSLKTTTTATGNSVSATFNMATDFQPRVGQTNRLEVVAVTADGKRSPGVAVPIRILPVPGFLQGVTGLLPAGYLSDNDPVISFEITVPNDADNAPDSVWQTLPFLGKFGGDFNVNAGFEYALRSGEWQVHLGTKPLGSWKGRVGERPHSRLLDPKWFLGNRELKFGVEGQMDGVASFTQGFQFTSMGANLTLDFRGEVLAFYLTDYVPGTQWVRVLDVAKRFGIDPNSIQRVRIDALMGANLSLVGEFQPTLHYGETTFGITAGLEASYAPDLGVVSLTIYAGGEVGANLEWPAGQSLRLKDITGTIYGGIEAEVFTLKVIDEQFALLDYRWVLASAAAYPRMQAALSSHAVVHVGGEDYVSIPISQSTAPVPAERPNLVRGVEAFVGGNAKAGVVQAMTVPGAKRAGLAPAEAFRRMGAGGIPGAVGEAVLVSVASEADANGPRPIAAMATPAVAASAVAPAQADLPLVANIYPTAAPAFAGRANELMLLYVKDNGGADLQFTDIAWTRFDGTNWSTPATIAMDTRAEFAPQVRYDGNGDAVAVWQRVKDPAYSILDVTAMAAQMEIVWARWDHNTGLWSAPVALTDNAYLDQKPMLSGQMTNGDLLLVWTANEANQFMGSGIAGSSANSRFMTARWEVATKTWGASAVLLNNVTGEMSPSLDGQGDRAVLVWGRDLDGDVTTQTDTEIYYANWQGSTWGPAVQFTNDAVSDVNARIAVSETGDRHLVWRAGSDLNWSTNFGTAVVARAGSDTTGFADYALTVGPSGNVVLIWQEASDFGSDAHYRIYDPASATWGLDDLLTADASLERSFAPVWDAAGNLTMAYLKVQMGKTSKTVTLPDNSVLTIDNVPQRGQVDMAVTKRALVRDAAILPGDFVVTGGNFLPGDMLTLKSTVRNSGNVALSNSKVAFYNGDPAAGGVKIGEATSTGWLPAADKAELSATWVLPTTATAVQLFAVVDPDGVVTENREDNNRQALGVGGSDLVARYRSSTASSDGSLRIIAEAQNIGMPATPATTMQVRASGSVAVLGEVEVPVLQPGEIAQLALDLPTGTQPNREMGFLLSVDDDAAIPDVNPDNNLSVFVSNPWTSQSPVISGVLTANAEFGAPFDYSISASNYPASYDAIGLPAGLSVDTATGVISGNPTVTGAFAVTIGATNSSGATTTTLTINVAANFASWQVSKFTSEELSNMAKSGATAVYGTDGLANLVKYALGLDPKENATTELPVLTSNGTDWVYTYTRPADRNDIDYVVEVSTDLLNWTQNGVTHEQVSPPSDPQVWRGRFPISGTPNLFARLRVTRAVP